jgi:nucleoside-diphosphate-sugar epimerase
VRIFVAGATGVIGVRLVALLVQAPHNVAGMTRSPEKVDGLRSIGAEPVICDVFDHEALTASLMSYRPDAIVDELTDLPDAAGEIAQFRARNDRMRVEGTKNLLAAALAADVRRIVSQSIAWKHPNDQARAAVQAHERMVRDAGGVVVRYGQLYGPGTFYPQELPPLPRIHVDEAARRTIPALGAPPGSTLVIAEDQRTRSPKRRDRRTRGATDEIDEFARLRTFEVLER